jgi:surface carbohydrate biosynthesis protein
VLDKLSWIYRIFLAAQKQWILPLHTDVVIYHLAGSDLLSKYLKGASCQILVLDGGVINIPVLIKSLLNKNFWLGRPDRAYVWSFLALVEPKIVVSFIDNDPLFYEISDRFEGIKTILLQNGTRDNWLDRFSMDRNWRVDAIFAHNPSIGQYYQTRIASNIYPSGAFKNNLVPISSNKYRDEVLFLSQYHQKLMPGKPIVFDANGKGYGWEEFFAIDGLLIQHLDSWCSRHGKTLRVCGRETEKFGSEYQYFKERITKSAWIYEPSSSPLGAYQQLDIANIVVTVDSTLGYESLARGKKTAFFAGRGQFINSRARRFGWPGSLPENGPFWSASVNSDEVYRVMDYLAGESDAKWQKTCQTYAPQVMGFDPGNTILQSTLQQFLTSEQLKYA